MPRSKWKPRLIELLAGLPPREPVPPRIIERLQYYTVVNELDGKTCPLCGKEFSSRRSLMIHISVVHDHEIKIAIRGRAY